MSMAYCVVQIDLEDGHRVEYPWRFATADEAMNKIYELTDVDMKVTYIVKAEQERSLTVRTSE